MSSSLTKILNKRFAETIANVKPAGSNLSTTGSQFDQVLNKKRHNMMLDKLQQTLVNDDPTKNKMQVLSADNIDIKIQEGEFGAETNFSGKTAVYDLFSFMNNNSLKMDAMIEVLSSDDTKLSRRQILAYQATIGNLTINTELYSKLAQVIAQNLNTLLQTNMG